jgi:TetR/AcrR family transcriptional regulator, tetracycline repressor protein
MRFVEAGDYEKMTIRGLARELGVAPMSLYRHVRNKGDLLGEVVDRLQERSWRPQAAESDWRAWVAEAADKLRHFLVTEPAALHVYLRHPVVSPAAIDRMKAMIGVLHRSGADDDTVQRAYAAVHIYTVGFAALEASWGDRLPIDDDRDGGNDYMGEQLAAYTTRGQFTVGLRYLLDGIERDAEAGSDEDGVGTLPCVAPDALSATEGSGSSTAGSQVVQVGAGVDGRSERHPQPGSSRTSQLPKVGANNGSELPTGY